jgi:hypothetical protein
MSSEKYLDFRKKAEKREELTRQSLMCYERKDALKKSRIQDPEYLFSEQEEIQTLHSYIRGAQIFIDLWAEEKMKKMLSKSEPSDWVRDNERKGYVCFNYKWVVFPTFCTIKLQEGSRDADKEFDRAWCEGVSTHGRLPEWLHYLVPLLYTDEENKKDREKNEREWREKLESGVETEEDEE